MPAIISDISLKRSWTSEQKAAWVASRDQYRVKRGLDPLNDLREIEPEKYSSTMAMEREVLLKRLEKLTTKTFSWPVDKRPITQFLAPFAGCLRLPYSYKQRHGFHKVAFSCDQDLDMIVFDFYQDKVPFEYKPGANNFVSHDGIHALRHEYLGPSPHISGYQFNLENCTAEIEWYDDHLTEKWIETKHWKVEAYYDTDVEGWVAAMRSPFARILDYEYFGLES